MATSDFIVKNGLVVNQNLDVKGTTQFTSSVTALGDLSVQGNTTIGNATSDTFTVNTSGLTTSAATFSLANTATTNLSIGGAATTLALGASTGTATIANPTVTLTNATALNLNGVSPTLASTSTGTLTLFNTGLTAVNAFGAATTIGIGAATGTLTIGNPTITGTNATTFNMNGANPSIVTTSTGTASVFNTNILTGNLFRAATTVSIGATTGTTTVNNSLTVTGDLTVNGTTTTINATTLTVDDKNIELGSVAVPSNATADGGGITLKAAADKTFNWVSATDRWTSNVSIEAPTFVSTQATGTAPFAVTSTTKVTNLNADLLDDLNTSSTDTTGNSVVTRSGGNFSAGTITAALSGNATTASTLQTARSINGVSFNGGADIGFFDIFTQSVASPGPQTFTGSTIRGFDAYQSTDFPASFYTGLTVSGPGGVRSAQLGMNWNSEEAGPSGLIFRVNDDTGTPSAWSAWTKIWNENNDGSGSGLDADLLDGLNTSSSDTTGNSVVTRSGGNFSAGTITAALSGNATTSTSTTFVTSRDVDRNAGNTLPTTSPQSVRFDFSNSSTTGTGGNYAGTMTFAPYTGTTASTGDASYQLVFGSTAANGSGIPKLNIRKGIDSTWNSWYTLIHSGNTERSTWNTYGNSIGLVAGEIAWKNYGNGHTIFDASAGTSPAGGAVNNSTPQVAWSATYPTLMGWNGANTYGVRVNVAERLIGTEINAGATLTSGTVTGQWTLNAGSTWAATFADLAEWYSSDVDYEPGTVVVFGGEFETTISTTANDRKVAGVVSTNPAFIMNVDQPGPSACVALQGKVPVKVTGTVAKGDLLVTSDIPGVAMVNNDAGPYTVIGKALENKTTTEQGLIYVSVGR